MNKLLFGTRGLRVGLLMCAVLAATLVAASSTVRASEDEGDEEGERTVIDVHVISKSAKFVGTSMGGARVVVRDAATGEVLDSGVTSGSTGDTKRIMTAGPRQGDVMATDDAASFRAVLHLREPRKIEVTATGPLAQQQSATSTSQTQWVVPGQHITEGDAWLLELRGLVVDVLQPPAHVKLDGTPQDITLRANVTMMCGCPIGPGFPWKPEDFQVKAILRRGGEHVRTLEMDHDGEPSQYEASAEVEKPGTYQATVYAFEPATGNTGVDHATFIISD